MTKIHLRFKGEKILKGSLISIPPPSPSVKIHIMGGKNNNGRCFQKFVGITQQCFVLKTFPPII